MIFAALVIEREPLLWSELPAAIKSWLQVAGVVSFLALAIWTLVFFLGRRSARGPARLFLLLGALAAVGYGLGLLWLLARAMGIFLGPAPVPLEGRRPPLFSSLGDFLFAAAGLCAILAVTLPLFRDAISRIRLGRILALARLSLKEAVRSRVVWVFSAMAGIFLFADWFVPYKAEDQVRNYVRVIYWSLAPLFLLTASLLGAFAIPTDVKNQSIHTIVTKPVERFEIVLGRFFGFGLLLTVGLAALGALSLLYVLRGVTPEAAKESFTARVPVYGDKLWFHGTGSSQKGESVGREFDYRTYIGGPKSGAPPGLRPYAIWSFQDLSAAFAPGQALFFEFSFDIFRLTKGKENRGVITSFTFVDGRLGLLDLQKTLEKMQGDRNQLQAELGKKADGKRQQGTPETEVQQWQAKELAGIEERLIDKFAIFQVSEEVIDYHTQSLGGDDKLRVAQQLGRLFHKLQELEQAQPRSQGPDGLIPPMLNVLVGVDRQSADQMLGVAKHDLYLLAAQRPFWTNFLKGLIGMWFTVMLILGLAVACSTYLSGVISWLCTLFLYGSGFFGDAIKHLAEGKTYGGGPFESIYRILSRTAGGARLEDSPATNVLLGSDEIYRWWLRLFSRIIPDINRFDLHQYVANGFDISWSQVLFLDNLVPLVGYLLPWAVLAYYLIKYREVANPT